MYVDIGRVSGKCHGLPALPVTGDLLRLGRRGVADDRPVRGRGDAERERRLQIGLLELRVDAPGVRHLELRVEVDLAVDRVDEAVQALA
jgi:hypothetical protein